MWFGIDIKRNLLFKELKMNRKEFTVEIDGVQKNLCVRLPRTEDTQEADRIYATTVADMIKSPKNPKPLLRSQLESFLRENKIWTTEDEDKVRKLNSEITETLNKLRLGGIKLSEGREHAIQIIEKRKSILDIMAKRRTFDDTTIEAIAEDRRNDYLLFACTINPETSDRYWSSFEDFLQTKLTGVYNSVYKNFYAVLGIDSDFEKKLPEAQWLTKYKFVDENLNFIDRKTGTFVDRNGQPLKQDIEQSNTFMDITNETNPFIDDETNEPIVVAKPEG